MASDLIQAPLTQEQAQELVDTVRKQWNLMGESLQKIFDYRAWEPLGYKDFSEMFVKEKFYTFRLPREQRQLAVATMILEHPEKSQRQIADEMAVDEKTVRNDIKSITQVDTQQHTADKSAPKDDPEPLITFDDLLLSEEVPSYEVNDIVEMSKWSEDESALRKKVELGFAVVVDERPSSDYQNIIDWAKSNHIYVHIGRRGDKNGVTGIHWGNPFVLDEDGTRSEVIKLYSEHYLPFKSQLKGNTHLLKGKVLACWCAPAPCHGDVLADLANGVIDGEV